MKLLTHRAALRKIANHTRPLAPKSLPLAEALGLVLAKDFRAPEPFPAFDNAAVDGYAISGEPAGSAFRVSGEVRAGQSMEGVIARGQALRVFTGAPVPRGTYAVVMQEDAQRVNGHVQVFAPPRRGQNIRRRGEDFLPGTRLLRKGTVLGPAQLALLSAMGAQRVAVYPRPVVAILATGSELARPGARLAPGQVRDCNTMLMASLVRRLGACAKVMRPVRDDRTRLARALPEGLRADLLLVAGGVSVGDYDFVRCELARLAVRQVFWGVDIKPGKPLYFGHRGHRLVFGLPGNPVSVFVTFEEFVRPALERLMSRRPGARACVEGRLASRFRNGSRDQFVRVRCLTSRGLGKLPRVVPLRGQGSHQVGALATADALWHVEARARFRRNQRVWVKSIGGERSW